MARLVGGKRRRLILGLLVGAAGVVLLPLAQAQGAQSSSASTQQMQVVGTSEQQGVKVVLDPFSLRTVVLRPAAQPTGVLGLGNQDLPTATGNVSAAVTAANGVHLRNSSVRIPQRPELRSPYQVGS
jgi:hypothetical protein